MELITFLTQQNQILQSLLDSLGKEKQALIQDDIQVIMEALEEKKQDMNQLEQLEKGRREAYPDVSLSKLRESGQLADDLEAAGKERKRLAESISELQETNQMLTKQSLSYTNRLLDILLGDRKPTYNASGKVGEQADRTSILNQSI